MFELKKDDTLGAIVDRAAAQFPRQEAIVSGSQRITFETLIHRVNSMANALLKMGVKKGDKAAIWMSNIPEWVYAHFACMKIGVPLVPLNTRYKSHEVDYILRKADVTTLFMMDKFINIDFIPMIYEVCPELNSSRPGELKSDKLPFLKRVMIFSEKENNGMLNYNAVLKSGEDYAGSAALKKAQRAVTPEDVYIIPFTSHYQYSRIMEAVSARFQMREKDRILVVSPFSHNMGNMTGMLLGGCNGACILPMEQFDLGEALRLIDEEKVSKFTGSPTMYIMMLDHADFPKRDTSSIQASVIGGADVSPDLVRTVIDKMGIKDLINAYGLTENTGVSTLTQPGDSPETIAYTAGRLIFPDCELNIIDPDKGKEVPRGTQGEICSRGFFVMKENYKQPEETKNAFNKDGWFRTGDLGTMDEKGYIKITGRLKDMFITGGVNAYPAETESFLMTHPKISMVAVTGVPDHRMGEVAMAFVKLKEGETATEEEIIKFARAKMANYKAPKYVKFVTDFPMTLTGKIQKFVLKETAIKELGLGKQ